MGFFVVAVCFFFGDAVGVVLSGFALDGEDCVTSGDELFVDHCFSPVSICCRRNFWVN